MKGPSGLLVSSFVYPTKETHPPYDGGNLRFCVCKRGRCTSPYFLPTVVSTGCWVFQVSQACPILTTVVGILSGFD